MKKSHGPAFKKAIVPLATCPACKGKAFVNGVFHQIDCVQCNASGWVRFDNGEALEIHDLVFQLGTALSAACRQANGREVQAGPVRTSDVSGYYSQNNRRGAGGTNYTGD
ncbi:hypothetical protein WDV92_10635 [Pseudomonas syringae pv. atrofaciens]